MKLVNTPRHGHKKEIRCFIKGKRWNETFEIGVPAAVVKLFLICPVVPEAKFSYGINWKQKKLNSLWIIVSSCLNTVAQSVAGIQNFTILPYYLYLRLFYGYSTNLRIVFVGYFIILLIWRLMPIVISKRCKFSSYWDGGCSIINMRTIVTFLHTVLVDNPNGWQLPCC